MFVSLYPKITSKNHYIMNNIVVGFDFSSGSAKAVDLAIDIANRWHEDIRLVYVKKDSHEDDANQRQEIESRIDAVKHLLKDIKLEYVIRTGKVHQELAAQANEDQASLVIVGTHGMSGFQHNWIGKNTYHTITESEVPVLSVREDFNFNKSLDTIILPLDSSTATRQKAPLAAKFAKTLGSTIHILGLYTSENKDIHRLVNGYVEQVENYMAKNNIKYVTECVDVSKNLTVTTLEYAEKVNADLIVIMTEQEKALNSWFMGSYASQMLNLSKRPVLSMRPEEYGSVAR